MLSWQEDYGLVTIEAMMSSKPVVTCADSGGTLEFVRDGTTGLVAQPDARDIAAKIDLLVGDPEQAAAMGRAGHESVTHITWERTVKTLLGAGTRRGIALGSRWPRRVSRPKITVALPFPVAPPRGGGQQRAFSLYRAIARDFDVDLVTVADTGSEPLEGSLRRGCGRSGSRRVPPIGRRKRSWPPARPTSPSATSRSRYSRRAPSTTSGKRAS